MPSDVAAAVEQELIRLADTRLFRLWGVFLGTSVILNTCHRICVNKDAPILHFNPSGAGCVTDE